MEALVFSTDTLFRYRKYSPTTLKELLYGEFFLVSQRELNDPYDTKKSAVFSGDPEIYKRLFIAVAKDPLLPITYWPQNVDYNEMANYLGHSKLHYDELKEKIQTREFELKVINAVGNSGISEAIIVGLNF